MSLYEDITGKKYVEPSKKELQTIPDWMRNSQPQKKKKNKIIKKSSYLEDGYDFGDITKTILSTTGDLATNVSKGFMNTIEGTVDTARYAIGNATKNSAELQAKVWDFLGNEAYANELRKAGQNVKDYTYKNAQMNVTGALLGETNDLFQTNWSQKLNEGSAAGTLVNSVEQGIGNIGAFVGLAGIGGLAANGAGALGASTTTTNALTSLTSSNASTFVNSFTSAFGNSMSNALNSGLDEKEARGQAITSGLAEAISEQFFQGIPGLKSAGWADNLISKPIGKYFSGKTGKVALKVFDSLGEGFEEVISNVLQSTFEGIRKGDNIKNIWDDVKNQATNEETRDAFISALISSALTNGGSALITNSQKNQIIDSYAKEHDMSVQETKQLFDSIVEKKANLEDTANYKERVEAEEGISKQLVQDLKTDNKLDLNKLFNQTPNSVKEMQFRFNQDEAENVRTEKQNILANDMARLNNEKSNHELYKVVNAIQSANDTQQYHITTTEGLYEMGIVKKNNKGEYVMPDGSPYVPRGLNYKNGEIYINADVGSQSGTQAVYHEMFEGFKKAAPEQYNEFKQMVTDIIGEEAIQKEFDTYKAMYGEELTDDIRDEIINDKFGELAENQNFINKIADNRNVLEKLIDSVKSMIKYVKGTPEEKEFIKLQNKLEKEFAKRYKETDFSKSNTEGTALSLLENKQEYNLGSYQSGLSKTDNSYKYNKVYTYDIKNGGKGDNVQVSVTKTGYVWNNAMLSDSIKGKGEGTKIALDLNQQSIEETGYPLRSLPEYNIVGTKNHTNEGKGLWDSLVKKGFAVKNNDNSYTMLDTAPTEEEYINSIEKSTKIEYNNRQDFTDALEGKEWHDYYEKVDNHGLVETTPGSKSTIIVGDKVIRAIHDGTKPNVYEVYDAANYSNSIFEKYGVTTEDIIQDLYEICGKENIDEREIENRLEKYFNEGLLRRYDSNYNDFVSKNEQAKRNTRQIDTNIGTGFNREGNISNVEQNGDVDNTSFSLTSTKDSQGRNLTPQQQEYFKDSKVVDENGNLKVMYRGGNENINVFDKNHTATRYTNLGTAYEADVKGFFFTDNIEYAKEFGKPKEYYINATKPLTMDNIDDLNKIFKPMLDDMLDNQDIYQWQYDKAVEDNTIYRRFIDENGVSWEDIDKPAFNESIKIMQDLGYDSLYTNEGNGEKALFVFNSNQIKNIDNTNPTSNEDIRYSLAPTGEMVDNKGEKVTFEVSEVETELPLRDEKKLMVLHNLGENKMNGIMDLDGIPVPSLAITNPYKVDHSGFGEATLIFNKDTINPTNRLNEVYDRDVWSPTQPQIDYDIKFNDLMDLEDKIYNKHDAIAGTALNRYFDKENLSDNVDRYGIEGTIEEAKNSDELKYIYYKTMNPDFEILKKTDTEDLSTRYSNELLQEFNTQYGKEIPNWMNISDEQRKEVINDFRNYWKPILEARRDEIIAEENAKPEPKRFVIGMAESSVGNNLEWLDSLGGQDKLIEHLHEIQNNSGIREVNDIEGTKEFVNNNINQEEYNKWVDDTLGNLLRNAEKGIYNGKDYITAHGRRTFKQTHDKYTLENLVKALTKGDTKGTQQTMVTGYGQIQAQLANQFNSIEEIRNAENQIMSDEEAKILTEQLHNAINEDIDALADRLDGDYFNMNNASEMIFEYAGKKNRNEETFRKIAKDYANHGIPSELIQKITNDLEQLKNMPTDYFEAKPQRAVGLDEIGIGLIPTTWSEETKQRMRDKGIKFIEYDKSIEGERQRLEKELTDFMFSLTSNQNIDSKEIAPIREDISNLSNQLNNLSNQIQTLQNGAETASDNEIAPVNPYRERAIAQREANQRAEEMYKDENYWKSLEEIANQVSDLDEKSARKMSRNIGKELGLKQKQVKDLQGIIQNAFDKGYSLQEIRNELEMQFGHQTVSERLDEVIDAQRELRDVKIKVSPEIQKDIADYGYWKQQYFGKIKFSNDGSPVDVAYAQLSERNPSMYPSDIINPTDQLLRIAEVADMDRKYTYDYEMDRNTIDEAANYINDTIQETLYSNAMKAQTDLEQNAMQYNERTKDIPIKKRTRAEVRENLQNTMGITVDDLQVGKDIGSMSYNLTTPERVNEKVFGREVGRKINEQTVFFAKHQEAERTRFLNRERQEIKDLGIKARSKESALVQQYGEGLLDDVQLAQAVSDKATQEKIKNAARVLRSKYDTYLDQINEELVEMGYDPIPKRKDYMRHFQELSDKFSQAGIPFNRQALNAENLPTDINGLTEFNVPGKNWFASAQRRTGDKTTFDAITGIDGYLEGASNLMYHTETIQRYRALEKLIRDTYGQQHGLDVFGDDLTSEQAIQRITDIENGKLSNYVAWLKEQGNAIAGKKGALDRGAERLLGRRGYTLASELKKQVGSNMTGFNVRSALTNFISSTIAASKTNKLAMVKGTVDTIRNIFHDDGFINRSDFLTNRFGSDTLSQKTWQKISNAGQIFMSGSDWFTSNVITRSKYYEGIQKGMTDEQAMAYANDFAARVMGDRSKGATAEAFNSKTLGFLTQFQLETNNQWQFMIHDTKMEYQENLAKDGGLKAGATILFQVGQLAAYSYLFNEMFEQLTGSRAAFDILDIIKKLFGLGDDDKDKPFEERMKEAGSELVDALPFASLFGSGGRMPIGEMLTPAQTVYDYITGGTNKYGQDITLKDVKNDTLEAIPYYVLPTGYGQIKKTAKGLGMYANEVPGSYTDSGNLRFTADTDTGSVIKNALFGQWAGDEAQKYRESGYKTIKANDIQEMQDLNMKSSEYREYKNNLKEAGSKNADKLDYIDSLNIPISQKNIMASNVLDRDVDMSNYTTYEEFDYAYKNPGKYAAMKAIANDYESYNTYISGIEEVRDKYSQNKGYSTEQRKSKVISYVNSLDLTIPQKAMLLRQYYSSYKRYNNEIVNYVSSLDVEYQDKVEILQSLKFKVDDEGNVSW